MIFFGRVLTTLSFFLLVFSCAQTTQQANDDFNKKYSQQVEKIKMERTPQNDDASKQVMFSTPPTPEQVAIETSNDYYPYTDIAKFGEKLPQNYLPNAEFYDQAKRKVGSLAPNIFDITYNTVLCPPFHRIGAEFDVIRIPQYDAYGIKTAMSDKTYLLPDGRSVQQTIDLIENEKTSQDVEISTILISEKKQIMRKKKSAKMLGEEDNAELAALDENKAKEKPKQEAAEKPNPEKIQQVSNGNPSGLTIRTVKN